MHFRFGCAARRVLLVVSLLILSVQFPLSLAQSAGPAITHDVPTAQSLLNLDRPGSISGYVLSTHGHDTQNLHVQLLSANGSLLRSVRTDEDGSYGFYPVNAGRYRLRVLGQRGQMLSVENPAALVIDLDDGQRLSGHNLRLGAGPASNAPAIIAPTYQITGVVTAADSGLPFTSVEIDASSLDGTYQSSGYPDAQGRYGISGIGAGSYKLVFLVYGGGNYETEWYSGQPDFSSANVVNVTTGAVTGSINAALSNGGGHISGTVTSADTHAPIPNASVLVIDNQGFTIGSSMADGSGNYVTPGLRTGSYRLRFRALYPYERYLRTYFDGKTTLNTADPVSVTAPNTTPNINGMLLLGAQIIGHVSRSDNGQPIQYAGAAVYDCLGKAWATAGTDASGNYSTTVGLPSGIYRVGFTPPSANTYVAQAFSARPDLLSADRIAVTAPSVISNIDAVLTTVNGTITGTVTDSSNGLPLAGISVRAFDGAGGVVQTTSSDGTGQYTLSGLPTGDYRVGFHSPNYVRLYYNNKPDLLSGDTVHVEASGVVQNVNGVMATGATIGGIAAVEGITGTGSVRVQVYDNNGRFVSSAVTYNSDGSYQTDPVPAGTYRLLFVPPPPDYGYQYYNGKLALNAADGVVVNPPTNTWVVNAALHRGGQIMVNVNRQATGYPNTLFVNAFNSSGHIVASFTSGFSGPFLTSALPSGDYRLQIDASAIAPACAGPYMSGYYNFKPDFASADLVHVNTPDITGGINITLLFRSLLLPSMRR